MNGTTVVFWFWFCLTSRREEILSGSSSSHSGEAGSEKKNSNRGLSRWGWSMIGRWRWRGRSADIIGYAKARMLEWKMERFECVECGGAHHKHANWTSTERDLVNPRMLTSAGGSSVTRKRVSYISAVLFRKQWRVPVSMTRGKKNRVQMKVKTHDLFTKMVQRAYLQVSIFFRQSGKSR